MEVELTEFNPTISVCKFPSLPEFVDEIILQSNVTTTMDNTYIMLAFNYTSDVWKMITVDATEFGNCALLDLGKTNYSKVQTKTHGCKA